VPFDASAAHTRGPTSVDKLNQGGLPLVLGQTFRAVIHSRMQVGMERYRAQYPDARIVLFEPNREDADMFFANIFSYRQRKRLCSLAFEKTRQSIAARAPVLAPALREFGITLRADRIADATRSIVATLNDPRPLRSNSSPRCVRQTARELGHTLDQLERAVAAAR